MGRAPSRKKAARLISTLFMLGSEYVALRCYGDASLMPARYWRAYTFVGAATGPAPRLARQLQNLYEIFAAPQPGFSRAATMP